jgi:hypothetical protein
MRIAVGDPCSEQVEVYLDGEKVRWAVAADDREG